MTKYFDSSTNTFAPIPKAEFYVLSNDTFMSGWGSAQGKINTCVVPCDTYAEAENVARYVRTRADQKRIRITSDVRAKANVVYSMCLSWRDRAITDQRHAVLNVSTDTVGAMEVADEHD